LQRGEVLDIENKAALAVCAVVDINISTGPGHDRIGNRLTVVVMERNAFQSIVAIVDTLDAFATVARRETHFVEQRTTGTERALETAVGVVCLKLSGTDQNTIEVETDFAKLVAVFALEEFE